MARKLKTFILGPVVFVLICIVFIYSTSLQLPTIGFPHMVLKDVGLNPFRSNDVDQEKLITKDSLDGGYGGTRNILLQKGVNQSIQTNKSNLVVDLKRTLTVSDKPANVINRSEQDNSVQPFECVYNNPDEYSLPSEVSSMPHVVNNSIVKADEEMLEQPYGAESGFNVLKLSPVKFLKEYKNPCWKERIPDGPVHQSHFGRYSSGLGQYYNYLISRGQPWRLRCLPYAYIIGMPKCGSTDLWARLSKHANIVPALMKEPKWWSRKRYKNQSFADYLDTFDGASACIQTQYINTTNGPYHHKITFDGSPSTMWYNDEWKEQPENANLSEPRYLTAHSIHHLQPDARFLVTLRDPTDRSYSNYHSFTKHNTSTINFHQEVEEAIQLFELCTTNRSIRACVYDKSFRKHSVQLVTGMYYVYLKDWFAVYPRDHFYISKMEDYSKDTKSHMKAIFSFLDVGPMPSHALEKVIKEPISNERSKSDKGIGPMLNKTRQMLDKLYGPFNKQLASLLQDNRFLWTT